MNGILPLWKPAGWTSHDCVHWARKLLQTKKIGHAGTLDPEVTGVLPLAVGKATKVLQYMQLLNKGYEAEITLGFSTTTEDQTGEIVEQKPVSEPIPREKIFQALKALTGEIIQIPPMYSAVKVQGKRLYEYAREGKEVERPKRSVTIFQLELMDEKPQYEAVEGIVRFPISVLCSKGTYIRTLAVSIGELLGYPAHMSKLVRTLSSGFRQEDCFTMEQLENLRNSGKLFESLQPIEAALKHLPKMELTEDLALKVKNGAVLPLPQSLESFGDQPIALYFQNKVIAIYKKHPSKQWLMKPDRVLA